ncbi:hypothetical protein FNH13_16305 [Ornithinimicrobium ciconiae]|uniref:Uncharacterized protein n=1 Tax=Ornithinimicrobium ciconiae TaxID=2594265 RepID=A0A516GDT6_9MICO|nr:hypothetical protein [Ornithinimicrobium ciconiae]QDO89703.1 hypothetical protein FNH13_16305 [Ornithinimicrobium ciconiae]
MDPAPGGFLHRCHESFGRRASAPHKRVAEHNEIDERQVSCEVEKQILWGRNRQAAKPDRLTSRLVDHDLSMSRTAPPGSDAGMEHWHIRHDRSVESGSRVMGQEGVLSRDQKCSARLGTSGGRLC